MTTDQRAKELREVLDHFRDFQRDTTDPIPTVLYLKLWEIIEERAYQLEGQALVIEKVDGEWPEWAVDAGGFFAPDGGFIEPRLDALLEAQMQLVPLPDRSEP